MTRLTVKTSDVWGCRKCGRNVETFRHHKGNDGLLKLYNKRIARQYYDYLDCVRLCQDCHCEIHYLYDKLILRYWLDKTPRGANTIRKRCIKLADRWLAGDVEAPEIPEEFKQGFSESLEEWREWRKEQQETG